MGPWNDQQASNAPAVAEDLDTDGSPVGGAEGLAEAGAQVNHCSVPPGFYAQGHAAYAFMNDNAVLEIRRADAAVSARIIFRFDFHKNVVAELNVAF